MTGKAIFLHLSDLHFGDQNETNSAKRANTLNKLLLTLKNLPTEWKPQSIAISGDIGWHGLENIFSLDCPPIHLLFDEGKTDKIGYGEVI